MEALSFNPDIFKYPPVQYIPLAIHTLERDPNWRQPSENIRPQVQVWQKEAHLNEGLARLGIPTPRSPLDLNKRVVVLVTHGQVEDVKYRAHTVYLVGRETPGGYHLFGLTRQYFYKKRLHFAFFAHTGERLAWDNVLLGGNL